MTDLLAGMVAGVDARVQESGNGERRDGIASANVYEYVDGEKRGMPRSEQFP